MDVRKAFAELIGTFMLVFLGTGTVVIGKGDTLAIGLAFGLAITVMACSVGAVSGGHFNPAVTIAMLVNKRIDVKNAIVYIISQFIGAILASAVLSIFVHALGLANDGYGQNDFTKISSGTALFVEVLLTFLFIFVILMVTSAKFGNPTLAPLAIGLTLSFLIIVGLNLTGGSLNPARSFGPAVFAGGTALSHYWVFVVGPVVGGVLAAFVAKFVGSEEAA